MIKRTLVLCALSSIFLGAAANGCLVVELIGSGQGAVTSHPGGIDCGTTCSGLFPADTSVTFTAAPEAGSCFVGWRTASGDRAYCSGGYHGSTLRAEFEENNEVSEDSCLTSSEDLQCLVKTTQGSCGDGIIDDGEACDGSGETEHCHANCTRRRLTGTSVRCSDETQWNNSCGGINMPACCIHTSSEPACFVCPWSKKVLEWECEPGLTMDGTTCRGPSGNPPPETAWLYQNCDYTGHFTSINTSSGTAPNSVMGKFNFMGIGDNLNQAISSMKVGPDAFVSLYKEKEWTGESWSTHTNVPCLSASNPGFNDAAQSVEIGYCPEMSAPAHGRRLTAVDSRCLSPTPIQVNELPEEVTADGVALSGLKGLVAIVDVAQVDFSVPNGQSVAIGGTEVLADGQIHGVTCADLGDKGHDGKVWKDALYNLMDWRSIHPANLLVNGNWFDVTRDEFKSSHQNRCSNLRGLSVSQGAVLSNAFTANADDLLDGLLVGTALKNNPEQNIPVAIASNAEIRSVYTAPQNAVGGFIILKEGSFVESPSSNNPEQTWSRSGVGLSEDGQTLIVIVEQRGRFLDVKEGLSARNFARLLKHYGAWTAINLDNSGSSQMVYYENNSQTEPTRRTLKGDLIDCDWENLRVPCNQEELAAEENGDDVHRYRPVPNFLGISPRAD